LGIETLELEVDDEDSVKRLKGEVEGLLEGRGLDYLVNNAYDHLDRWFGRWTGAWVVIDISNDY
jgi:hypothetical protein